MKIVVLDGYCLNPGDLSWSGMEAQGALTVYDRTPLDGEDEIVRRIGDSEIVLTNKTPISRRTLERCPGVKYIGILATGYNVVETEAARERSIPVCNVPGYGTRSVAQAAIALLLEICHHVGHHDQAVHQGAWSRCADYCFWDYPLIELAGKTMGIVGYGSIGRAVGEIAAALGMEIVAYSRRSWPDGSAAARYVPLEEPCTLVNISVGGACISSKTRHDVGDRFLLWVRLLPELEPSMMYCQILRIVTRKHEYYEYGCSFSRMTEIDQEKINQTIFAIQRKK